MELRTGGHVSSLEPWERSFIRPMLHAKLDELHGESFEDFFHRLMCARDPGFIDVRAYGNIGDLSADGLSLHDRTLYACYGPKSDGLRHLPGKLNGDLAGALAKRPGEFDRFAFVHSDRYGMHPEVSRLLSKTRDEYPDLIFENFGRHRFHNELCRLDRWQVEDLLGPFPAQPVVSGVALTDLMPLLDHLAEHRRPVEDLPAIPRPSVEKMSYNSFSPDEKRRMSTALPYVQHVDTYYAGRRDPNERDETAAGFRDHYQLVKATSTDPDEILGLLEQHILGNAKPSQQMHLNALVLLMYFFGECDIFEVPPPGWSSAARSEVVM